MAAETDRAEDVAVSVAEPWTLRGRPPSKEGLERRKRRGREITTARLWQVAPGVLAYVAAVALGREKYDKGRLAAASMILSRCVPTITSQTVVADSRSVSVSVEADRGVALERMAAEIAAFAGSGNG
jgi:hypothetical protein